MFHVLLISGDFVLGLDQYQQSWLSFFFFWYNQKLNKNQSAEENKFVSFSIQGGSKKESNFISSFIVISSKIMWAQVISSEVANKLTH